ncbi:double-strand break repair helicase AddA [Pacificimonas sp. WHA3]|uniref:DNA 3'-5' helicase n=1 Tax=Pacificimonas pallii TaxID=2827236 RepID=A0ABS6SAZ9_9SPHN|nr:double-strand break repair helicase AddA [Pacificimonas pallii]MBV7255486.1 double-strand break repair helicase AddA [Pacificimonas pallii]
MSARTQALHPLRDEQMRAVDPWVHAWVSASAGTGKTQVLTARVLRLLVEGATPDGIMALTFTKAAAAEMQSRILDVLARWVRADDAALSNDLRAIGARDDADTLSRARTLFAGALEVKGGFRVQTLHAFAASLLAAFPIEAGVVPGFATLEDRSGAQLRADVLEDVAADAEDRHDEAFLGDLATLAVRYGDAGAASIVADLLRVRRDLMQLPAETLQQEVRRRLDLPATGAAADLLRAEMAKMPGLMTAAEDYAAALNSWDTPTGRKRLDLLSAFLLANADARHEALAQLYGSCLTGGGAGAAFKPVAKLAGTDERMADLAIRLRDVERLIELADIAEFHLSVGQRIARRYEAAKGHLGALDFDDLIARAAALLSGIETSWVLYKLDQRIDHVLVDEGQDTNADQWKIVDALTEEFFSGVGTRDPDDEGPRTKFAVGDYKQAIFGFQGTNPEEFLAARTRTEAQVEDAGQSFVNVELATSFRSVQAVLTVVDKVLETLGPEAIGLNELPRPHEAFRGAAGAVTLWPRLTDADGNIPDEYADYPERALAQRIAREVKGWLTGGIDGAPLWLPSKDRSARAQDILILVRNRGDLVPELVAALHAANVNVAGADRLRLTQPLVVQDCLSLVKFALQPDDDLSLAELLVSPFLGWTQDQLYDVAHKRGQAVSLWSALRDRQDERAVGAVRWLEQVLAMADFSTPYAFLEEVMSGPEHRGRARLLARLGPEARDPLEELLSQALAYERIEVPSLQGFLEWMSAADDIDIKRDPDAPSDAVRIMTVHGAKGLQAPIVIMADAARAHAGTHRLDHLMLEGVSAGDPRLPLYGVSKSTLPELLQPLYEKREEEDSQENLRLLYVAMTRAEDYLYAGGLPAARSAVQTWYDVMHQAMLSLETEEVASDIWAAPALRHKSGARARMRDAADAVPSPRPALPDWARRPAPPEAKPPRPLAPSAPEDDSGLPPPGPQLEAASLRGRLMHSLFERLPALPGMDRAEAARQWLARRGSMLAEHGLDQERLAAEVMAVLENPAHAQLFTEGALREAPISAIVDERVISGTIDTLLVEPDRVRVVDFKTDRRVPREPADIPRRHAAQMARYAAALERIFPGRKIEAGLLYTAGPVLHWLADDIARP